MPADFDPPRELVLTAMQLVPLGVEHNESDHAAWTSSIAHIRATPGLGSAEWPPIEGMSLDADRGDLGEHARDFVERAGFTFTVLRPDSNEVIGCVYIYPARNDEHDAHGDTETNRHALPSAALPRTALERREVAAHATHGDAIPAEARRLAAGGGSVAWGQCPLGRRAYAA